MAAVSPLAAARRLVVKVGSALLTGGEGERADHAWLLAFAADVRRLTDQGKRLLVVSSGAVALGRRRLGLARPELSLAEKQAAAAAGQSLLMRAWEEAFEPAGLACAQILLTPDDTEVRRRFVNARSTLAALLELGVLPVINENDTVVTDELRYGDNDRLAARVAQMAGADLLVLLSDVDGLYTADPALDPMARHLARVERIDPAVRAMAGGESRRRPNARGGMASKLAAAQIAGAAGCATIVALGRGPAPLAALEAGARHTLFAPATTPAAAYKAWIAGSLAPRGRLLIDPGAEAALKAGKSLLPAGVRVVEGRFAKGDAVLVCDEAGAEIGRGLSRYGNAEGRRSAGLRSDAVLAELGYFPGPLIHADDLAIAGRGEA